MHRMRRLAHAFLAASDDDLLVAELQRLVAERHGAQARAAELVDAIGRDLIGDAGPDRGLPRRVLALRRRQDLAEHDLRNVARRDIGALHRLGDRTSPSLWADSAASDPLNAPIGVRA